MIPGRSAQTTKIIEALQALGEGESISLAQLIDIAGTNLPISGYVYSAREYLRKHHGVYFHARNKTLTRYIPFEITNGHLSWTKKTERRVIRQSQMLKDEKIENLTPDQQRLHQVCTMATDRAKDAMSTRALRIEIAKIDGEERARAIIEPRLLKVIP